MDKFKRVLLQITFTQYRSTIPCGSYAEIPINHPNVSNLRDLTLSQVNHKNYKDSLNFPEYALEIRRLETYVDWPIGLKQKPDELADSGFFYTQYSDKVTCFSCGITISQWEETDEVWEEHAFWSNNCNYLKLRKEPEFINKISNKSRVEKNKIKENFMKSEMYSNENNVCEINIQSNHMCKICCKNESNTLFLNCKHSYGCAKCSSSLFKCPICQKPIDKIIKIYFS